MDRVLEKVKGWLDVVKSWLVVPEGQIKKYLILLGVIAAIIALQICVITVSSCSSCEKEEGAVIITNEPELDSEHSRVVIIPMLVNKENTLSSDFVPNNLIKIGDQIDGVATQQINATVRQAYLLMQADMEKEEIKLPMVIGAYKSYERQSELYDEKVAELGSGQKVAAAPGTSEHQTGACLDLSTSGSTQNDFDETPAGKWIAENCHKYGFILRYPAYKRDITGVNAAPWHIRYVGVEHAMAMHEKNMCLEEYVEYLRANYPNAVNEVSPDQFPAPRWAGDTGEDDAADNANEIA